MLWSMAIISPNKNLVFEYDMYNKINIVFDIPTETQNYTIYLTKNRIHSLAHYSIYNPLQNWESPNV